MEVEYARAKLRKNKDDDLKQAFSKIPNSYDQSDIVREALRQFFFTCEGREPLFSPKQLFNSLTVVKPQHRSHIRDNDDLIFEATTIQLEKGEDDEFDLDNAIDSILD